MMKMTVFGLGAAGNKACIALIESGVVDKDHVKLLNTTSRDIPDEYKDPNLYIEFLSGLGGCGKEPAKGRAAITTAIQNKDIDMGQLLNEDSMEVVLVSSVEGGTGSGSVPVLATFFDAMDIPVHVFAFVGFQDEARGINNTLKFFKDLPEKVILHTIRNSYFLDYTNNYSIAEQAANQEFVQEIEILRGSKMVPSSQVIDDTDLYKINVTPGYMTINHIPLTGIKNTEGFNTAVSKAFEDSCYMDLDQSAKRIAVIINASEYVQKAVDNSLEVIKRYVGTPTEQFSHIQPDRDEDLEGDEYIDVIVCGMNYPERPIKNINAKYRKIKEKLNVGRKSFEDIYTDIDVDDDLDEFNVDIKQMVDPSKAEALFSANSIAGLAKAARAVKAAKEPAKETVTTETPSKPKIESVEVPNNPMRKKSGQQSFEAEVEMTEVIKHY